MELEEGRWTGETPRENPQILMGCWGTDRVPCPGWLLAFGSCNGIDSGSADCTQAKPTLLPFP